jgi:molybdopterin/thiamine biosynthesis adenylyltransferase
MDIESSEFYIRQATVPSVGSEGLARLRSSTIAIAGVGGVGSSAAYYLARSGVGRIRLIDQDIVQPSNLQRLHGATREDLFHPKAEVVSRELSESGQWSRVEPIVETITDRNVTELFKDVDLIFDGLDNFRTRYILNRSALQTHTPYLFTSAISEQAHLALLNPPKTPCLECIMPHVVDRFEDSCENLGVSPAITGLAGSIGAATIIRFLLRTPTRLTDHLMTIDMGGPEFLFTRLSKSNDCAVCSTLADGDAHASPVLTLLCGEHTANVLPPDRIDLELSRISARILTGRILANTNSVLVYQDGPYTISLFRNGRLLIGGVSGEGEASRVASRQRHDLCFTVTPSFKT